MQFFYKWKSEGHEAIVFLYFMELKNDIQGAK